MGIQNYLKRVSKATKDIKSAIEEKGVSVAQCDGFETLANKVKGAYRKVRSRKCYENTSYSEEQINADLKSRHYQDIFDMALYDFAKIGGYFETSHSENSISRTWRTEDEILGNIVAFVGMF